MKKSLTRLASPILLSLTLASVAVLAQEHAIYSETADAKVDIQNALTKAEKQHKRVILDFGGNWCGDCRSLDAYFHQGPNAILLKANYILVDVNIGKWDKNKDLAKKYEVPLEKGVPALAVLDPSGKVVYSQKNGEFESMRTMEPASVTKFLQQWKPGSPSN
jgi:thioredoxin 1